MKLSPHEFIQLIDMDLIFRLLKSIIIITFVKIIISIDFSFLPHKISFFCINQRFVLFISNPQIP